MLASILLGISKAVPEPYRMMESKMPARLKRLLPSLNVNARKKKQFLMHRRRHTLNFYSSSIPSVVLQLP